MYPKLFFLIVTMAFFSISCNREEAPTIIESDPSETIPFDYGIESMSGQITYLEQPPASLVLDQLVNDTLLFVFCERKNHTLRTALLLDMSLPGDYFPDEIPEEEQTWEALNPGTLPPGTIVDSYYFHYDNETYNDNFNASNYLNCIGQYQVNSTITFERPVLGIVMRAGVGATNTLGLANAELGLATVEYDERNLSHFPGINIADGCQSDRFILSEDRKTLTLKNNTDIHHDNYRVIVEVE